MIARILDILQGFDLINSETRWAWRIVLSKQSVGFLREFLLGLEVMYKTDRQKGGDDPTAY